MGRSLFAVVFAAGALTAAGCQKTGSYTLSWSFATEAAHVGCGAHGVDTIRVTGASAEGDGQDVAAICADGTLTQGVPVGSWTFMVHQLDVRGQEIVVTQLDTNGQPVMVPNPTAAAMIGEDARVTLDAVVLAARPECSDGVDNEPDGRVDLDDPDCGNDPNTATE